MPAPVTRRLPVGWRSLLLALAFIVAGLAALVLIPSPSGRLVRGLPPPRLPPPEGTPAPGSTIASLFARIDYPLQIPVQSSDTLRLTLSVESTSFGGTVTVGATPEATPGAGTVPAGAPNSLPTDLEHYRDVGAIVDTTTNSGSPTILWQMTSAPRQTLLTAPEASAPRRYLDSITFQWHVQAVAPGSDPTRILLTLYYIYLDGAEHDRGVDIMQTPTGMAAIQPGFGTTILPLLRIPVVALAGFAAGFGLLGFLWNVVQNVQAAAGLVGAVRRGHRWVRSRIGARRHAPAQTTQKNTVAGKHTERT